MTTLEVVTGFLGAGKTTYISRLLEATGSEGTVVLVNDFGEEGIDSSLFSGSVESLGAGCVCCTLKNEFITALKGILKQKPSRIIFEPSGVFMLTKALKKAQELDLKIIGVTSVVDGVNFHAQRADFAQFVDNQIMYADKIVISKSDRADVTSLKEDLALLYGGDILTLDKPYSQYTREDFLAHGSVKDFSEQNAHASPLCYSKKLTRTYSDFLLKHISRGFKDNRYGNVIRAKAVLNGQDGTSLLFNYVAGEVQITKLPFSDKSRIAVMGETLNLPRLRTEFF